MDETGLHTTTYGAQGSRVVFCHGLFGQGRNWTQVGKALADHHRVTLVDLPDHGRSAWGTSFSYVDMADHTAELLSAEDPVALVGHSMGGKVAMLMALRHPELVERLVVVDIAPGNSRDVSEFEHFVTTMRGLDLSQISTRQEADEAMAEAVPSTAVRGFLLQNLRREGDGWRWQMNLDLLGDSLGDLKDWPAEAVEGQEYDGPVLWVAGEKSGYVRDEDEEAMTRLFPRHRKVTIKRAGHWVHSEQPEVFLEVLRRFVDAG